ncbi:secreted RxLR effector protein 161-like [Lathyrus oleraceus]|uniref:secreted RxLR effector protein 161-like n=1 Tax=Pisum sativum TaxID=3888 RepID=UPI0021D08CD7|nr:secreted RxLR effector protein 161-like [Pisum sativum]
MEDAKSIDTPMPTNGKLERNENGKDVDMKKYRGMISSLLYLTTSRPNIIFSVCMCARYQSASKESHLKAVKHILRYIHDTSKYELWYSKGSDCNLVGYTDSDFAGCKSDRKSTTRTFHMFSNSLVSWHSKKKVFVALSASEAEYVASDSYYTQILWLKQQLLDFDIKLQCIPIMCDNTSTINLTKKLVLHSLIKNIEIRHPFLHDHVEK